MVEIGKKLEGMAATWLPKSASRLLQFGYSAPKTKVHIPACSQPCIYS